ncbi:hypothetical protein vseg_000642 [Gypsophila vaccaria]
MARSMKRSQVRIHVFLPLLALLLHSLLCSSSANNEVDVNNESSSLWNARKLGVVLKKGGGFARPRYVPSSSSSVARNSSHRESDAVKSQISWLRFTPLVALLFL